VCTHGCGRDAPPVDPAPIDPHEVVVEGAHRRKQLVQLSAPALRRAA
jgi:hypothetical protein